MTLYAVYKDGKLFRASYKQNVPFYSSILSAKKAIQSATNMLSIPYHLEKASMQEKQKYLDKEKKRYEIKEFELIEKGEIC